MSSDTDDTDDLLLIPPDFFLVQSEPEPPYYTIVDSLIKQVSNLQNRIQSIESTSDVSLVGSFLDLRDNMNLQSRNPRRFFSQDDLNQPTSTQSTPQKPREKQRLNSLPASPNIILKENISKFQSPQKSLHFGNKTEQNPEILHEIDTFISNVKTIQRNHAVRNLENDFNSNMISTKKRNPIQSGEGDQNLQKNLTTNTQDTFDLVEKESVNPMSIRSSNLQETSIKNHAWRCGDNIESVPQYGAGIRNSIFSHSNGFQAAQNHGISSETDLSSFSLDKSSDSSSESTQITAYDKYRKQEIKKPKFRDSCMNQQKTDLLQTPLHSNAMNVLNMHKKLLNNNSDISNDEILKKRGANTLTNTMGLLSLADIWGSTHLTKSPNKLSQKLQEEKLRRQHCEQIICELQNKNLELQQKLSVAIKVDDTKNTTLEQFQEALEKVSVRMEKLNEEKSIWEVEMANLKRKHAAEIEAANQKISHHEKEASKSLNLAHSNQEKISYLEHKCSNLEKELEVIELKFKEVEENYKKEVEKNKSLSDIITQKEIELKENKTVLNNAREEVSQSRKAVEICQAEFSAMKYDCTKLENELKDNKNLILNLSDQKRKLLNEIEVYKTSENTLKEALEESKLKLENTKLELRNFYQGQLELIVENKRKEMQGQLDQERQKNLEELKRKELSMAKTAANHIKEISEKCSLEIKLLEQKHHEEIKLYDIQLSQYRKEIENLQAKLASLPEKRAEIAKQLQKVMENQWHEALKLIGNTPSPYHNEQKLFDTGNNISPKAVESYTSLRNLHPQRQEPFGSTSDFDETPVSSRVGKNSESEIQKYINMLLNRAPGQPMQEASESNVQQQRSTWHPGVRPRKPK